MLVSKPEQKKSLFSFIIIRCSGLMVSKLNSSSSSPGSALARVSALCSLTRHLTLIVRSVARLLSQTRQDLRSLKAQATREGSRDKPPENFEI